MYLIRGQNNIKLFKKRFPEISLSATIGNFDGMHLGHKAILEKVKKNAKEKNLSTLVIFTEPHAAEYFSKVNNVCFYYLHIRNFMVRNNHRMGQTSIRAGCYTFFIS